MERAGNGERGRKTCSCLRPEEKKELLSRAYSALSNVWVLHCINLPPSPSAMIESIILPLHQWGSHGGKNEAQRSW